jgi:hypothetical protein
VVYSALTTYGANMFSGFVKQLHHLPAHAQLRPVCPKKQREKAWLISIYNSFLLILLSAVGYWHVRQYVKRRMGVKTVFYP